MFDHSSRQRKDDSERKVEAAVDIPTASDAESDLILPSWEAVGLSSGLENDNLSGQSNRTEDLGLGGVSGLLQMQQIANKDWRDSTDKTGGNLSSTVTMATTTTTPPTTIPAEEDSFMALFNNTFNDSANNNVFADINFPLDDGDGKELQLPISTSVSYQTSIVSTTGTLVWPETTVVSHFSKHVKTGIQQACANMIIDMIYAYPQMMTRRETFPPFIHANTPATQGDVVEDGQKRLPEQFTNCMSVAQLLAVRTDDTRSFIWATIRAEMRAFRNHLRTFDTFEAVSALQSCLLYLIVRAADDAPQEAQDDVEMLMIYDVQFPLPLNIGSSC